MKVARRELLMTPTALKEAMKSGILYYLEHEGNKIKFTKKNSKQASTRNLDDICNKIVGKNFFNPEDNRFYKSRLMRQGDFFGDRTEEYLVEMIENEMKKRKKLRVGYRGEDLVGQRQYKIRRNGISGKPDVVAIHAEGEVRRVYEVKTPGTQIKTMGVHMLMDDEYIRNSKNIIPDYHIDPEKIAAFDPEAYCQVQCYGHMFAIGKNSTSAWEEKRYPELYLVYGDYNVGNRKDTGRDISVFKVEVDIEFQKTLAVLVPLINKRINEIEKRLRKTGLRPYKHNEKYHEDSNSDNKKIDIGWG